METQERTQGQTNEQTQEKSIFLKGVAIGAIAGGAATLLRKGTRSRAKQNVSNARGTVTSITTKVRENPKETKDEMMTRVKEASSVLKDAVQSVQKLYEKANKEIRDDVGSLKEDSRIAKETLSEAKSDSKDAVETASEVKSDLKEAGKKMKQAKEEIVNGSSESNTER
ncbi:hypothetical protein VBD025_06740 [Virgibacillus flavescens]|uniref:hypothetical protein n=1 Tax=Virgibacillus flavescens TaxID=1611422 RepID=UPI003D32BFDB